MGFATTSSGGSGILGGVIVLVSLLAICGLALGHPRTKGKFRAARRTRHGNAAALFAAAELSQLTLTGAHLIPRSWSASRGAWVIVVVVLALALGALESNAVQRALVVLGAAAGVLGTVVTDGTLAAIELCLILALLATLLAMGQVLLGKSA